MKTDARLPSAPVSRFIRLAPAPPAPPRLPQIPIAALILAVRSAPGASAALSYAQTSTFPEDAVRQAPYQSGYGLLASCLAPHYLASGVNPLAPHHHWPDYPVYRSTRNLAGNCFDQRGLQLTAFGNAPFEEVQYATGGLFTTLIKTPVPADGAGGKTSLIKRLVLPTGGSAIYAGLARSVSFHDAILMGETNQLLAVMHQQLLENTAQVADQIDIILATLRSICRGSDMAVHSGLRIGGSLSGDYPLLRNRIAAYLQGSTVLQSALFPTTPTQLSPAQTTAMAAARSHATAFIWLAMESRRRCSQEPAFDRRGRLSCPRARADSRIQSTDEPCSLLSKRMDGTCIRALLEQSRLLFTRGPENDGQALLPTTVSFDDPLALFAAAKHGDLVVLDDRFHQHALAADLGYAFNPARCWRQPWANGARILAITHNVKKPRRPLSFAGHGLHTRFQAGKKPTAFHDEGGRPASDTSGAYMLAMNFDTSTRGYDLLPLPRS